MEVGEVSYLVNAAKFLAQECPEVARHVCSVAVDRAYETQQTLSRQICPTCATFLIVGVTCTDRHDRLLCLTCHRMTIKGQWKKPSRAAMLARQKAIASTKHNQQESGTVTDTLVSVIQPQKNSKSRERKKSRTKGLAALLAKQKAQAPTVSGALDLSDFMI